MDRVVIVSSLDSRGKIKVDVIMLKGNGKLELGMTFIRSVDDAVALKLHRALKRMGNWRRDVSWHAVHRGKGAVLRESETAWIELDKTAAAIMGISPRLNRLEQLAEAIGRVER